MDGGYGLWCLMLYLIHGWWVHNLVFDAILYRVHGWWVRTLVFDTIFGSWMVGMDSSV